jgi:hypothetical protein
VTESGPPAERRGFQFSRAQGVPRTRRSRRGRGRQEQVTDHDKRICEQTEEIEIRRAPEATWQGRASLRSMVTRRELGSRRRVDIMDFGETIDHLDHIAHGEFHGGLAAVLDDPDGYLAFKRLGRLAAVSIKAPFARSAEYDPSLPYNWAESSRQWAVTWPPSEADIAAHRREYDLLAAVADEWNRPMWTVAEFNIFLSLCRRARPVLCGESKAVEKAAKAAAALKSVEGSASVLTPSALITMGATEVASELATRMPELAEHTSIITAFTLILAFYGHEKACAYLRQFIASYDADLDRLGS